MQRAKFQGILVGTETDPEVDRADLAAQLAGLDKMFPAARRGGSNGRGA
jgi:hypothetical protein